jgi:glycosyltransferase involved in cell wall biosynthesis
MSVICFVTYEIHPTTWGGCGVLLRHAAEHLLRAGHEVVFLLDIPKHQFDQFVTKDRLGLPNADRCRAYHADTLCEDCTLPLDQSPGINAWKSVRFAHAVERVLNSEPRIDFVEFFEYCGVSYYSLTRRLFGDGPLAKPGISGVLPVLGSRLHNSLELIDDCSATRFLDRDRYQLYALERAGLRLSEAVLTPTRTYFDRYYRDKYQLPESQVVVSQSPKVPFPKVSRRPDPRGPFSIAYVGRMFGFKGVDQFVRAAVDLFHRRPQLTCTIDIIGPDAAESPFGSSYAEFLRSLVPAPLRERFTFTGHLSHEKIADRLNNALFAVFPNRFESFCYALHETYEAGVPVIVNDIPGWSDFFHHEKNSLVYDGRTDSLVSAMERMLDDDSLRHRLTRPYAVAESPLGTFYAAPRALRLLTGNTPTPQVLAVVLSEHGIDSAKPTLAALSAGSIRPTRIICLLAASPDDEETFWWLGRTWHLRDESGRAINSAEVHSLDAITILSAGDRPSPQWLERCTTALRNAPDAAFATTWASRELNGKPIITPTTIDLTPETYPFECGTRLSRALIRTQRGRMIADLLDQDLGALGEIGLIWQSVACHGRGVALDRPLINLTHESNVEPADPSILKYLLARYGGVFADRLKIYSGLMEDRARALQSQLRELAARTNTPAPASTNGTTAIEPSFDYRVRIADELGGSLLAKMAWKKMTRRLRGKAPPRHRP